jgi:hypothetical protein
MVQRVPTTTREGCSATTWMHTSLFGYGIGIILQAKLNDVHLTSAMAMAMAPTIAPNHTHALYSLSCMSEL